MIFNRHPRACNKLVVCNGTVFSNTQQVFWLGETPTPYSPKITIVHDNYTTIQSEKHSCRCTTITNIWQQTRTLNILHGLAVGVVVGLLR